MVITFHFIAALRGRPSSVETPFDKGGSRSVGGAAWIRTQPIPEPEMLYCPSDRISK